MKNEEKQLTKACKDFIKAYCEKHDMHPSQQDIEDAVDAGVAAMVLEVTNALEL